jgi:deleted-in-malignant-brain-tumors protein 1
MSTAAILVVIVLLAVGTVDVAVGQCTYGDVRLVWGQGPYEGNLQICINNTWGWVCHTSFGTPDATVVCNQLGYNGNGASIYRIYSYYGWPNASQPIWLDRLNCVGTETSLLNCPRQYAIGYATCNHNALAGVLCQYGGTCTNGDIRLIRSQTGTPQRNQGRVEVCHNSQWGTVCNDQWSTNDAKVACYQLGFYRDSATRYTSPNLYGQGFGNIWLDNLRCASTENSLFDCPANAVGVHNCDHSEDAGALCWQRTVSSCTNGDIQMIRPYGIGPAHDGMPIVCKGGIWGGACDDGWTCDNGRLMCKRLGYPGYLNRRDHRYLGWFTHIDTFNWNCNSGHNDLSECPYTYHSSCNSVIDFIDLICYDPIIG